MPASSTNDTAVNTILKIINTYGSVSQTMMSEVSGYSKGMISTGRRKRGHTLLKATSLSRKGIR